MLSQMLSSETSTKAFRVIKCGPNTEKEQIAQAQPMLLKSKEDSRELAVSLWWIRRGVYILRYKEEEHKEKDR